jgi:nucleoside 2-deoxyribosyltransferase
VYLAGPITGLNYGSATSWRETAEAVLTRRGVKALSPMRFKSFLAGEQVLGDRYSAFAISTAEAITARDRFDVQRCDVVLMNLLGAEKVSIGTMIEAGWADAFRKPIVLVAEADNIHRHGILETVAGFHVTTLEDGIEVVAALIGEL